MVHTFAQFVDNVGYVRNDEIVSREWVDTSNNDISLELQRSGELHESLTA